MKDKRETKILMLCIGMIILQVLWTIAIEGIGYIIGLSINILILTILVISELNSKSKEENKNGNV